jgi:antitoxin CcdA
MKPTRLPLTHKKLTVKKLANVAIDSDLIDAANDLGLNVQAICEQRLREKIQTSREQTWSSQHAEFIANYNAMVEAEGTALHEWRSF